MGQYPLLRNGSAKDYQAGGWGMGSDSNSSAENISQSQVEIFWVLTKPGFILGEERMMVLRETWNISW